MLDNFWAPYFFKEAVLSKRDKGNKPFNNSETLKAIAGFSQIGITIVASVLIGVLMGRFLDKVFGTSPWLLLVFSLLGAGAAFKLIFNFSKGKK